MGMTITEKLLAAHSRMKEVKSGDFIQAQIDVVMGNDASFPLALNELELAGADRVFDPKKIVLVLDHFTPNKDIQSAENSKRMREFAKRHKIFHFYEAGEMGIEHALLPEKGIVLPGDLVVGGDSHTCTYGGIGAFSTGVGSTDLAAAMITGELWFKVPESIKIVYKGDFQKWVDAKDLILFTIGDIGVDGALYRAIEFVGDAVERLPISGRFTIANMAVEAGAKNGIFQPDQITENYIRERANRVYEIFQSDSDAYYAEVKHYELGKIEPQVAFPSLPSNTVPISQVGNIPLDQVVIGSCTNGWIEDLRIAAKVLNGNQSASSVRLIIIPATQAIYREALKEGLFDIFLDAGAIISPPTCGPCVGGHMGVLARGERAIATTNRNFIGRMGHPESEVYLSNPAVAAASAVKGRIASPEEVIKK
jgi:3-isopropylmalate/(R)-2-methylmalate dehydratase large subunit